MARLKPRTEAGAEPAVLATLGPGRFEVSGDLGFEDATRMLVEGDAAFTGIEQAEIDLAKVRRVDSAGLALLLEWSLAARQSGRALRYLNTPSAIAALAGISDVSELLEPVVAGGG